MPCLYVFKLLNINQNIFEIKFYVWFEYRYGWHVLTNTFAYVFIRPMHLAKLKNELYFDELKNMLFHLSLKIIRCFLGKIYFKEIIASDFAHNMIIFLTPRKQNYQL